MGFAYFIGQTHYHKAMYNVGAEMRSILSKNKAKRTSTPYFSNFGAVRVGCVLRTFILFNAFLCAFYYI